MATRSVPKVGRTKTLTIAEVFDLGGQLGTITGSTTARNYIGRARVNPASNGWTRDAQL